MTHWEKQAKQWSLISTPLKPSPIDIQNHISWLADKIQIHHQPLSVLILGVTPELVHMPWPVHTSLLAIDYSDIMVNDILPAKTSTIKPIGLIGNWLQLPVTNTSIDIVMGDGSYSSLDRKDYAILSQEIRRVLKPSGLFIMRFFCNSTDTDSLEAIHSDLLTGKIDSFHAFKLRLAMLLQDNTNQGVCLKNVWECWNDRFSNSIKTHKQSSQWNNDIIASIDTYKNNSVRYTFPALPEIRNTLSSYFIEKNIFTPAYYLGQCCPSLLLTPIR